MSFAIFDYDGKCVGEGKTRAEAERQACETAPLAGCAKFRLVEYVRGDQDSQWIDLYPDNDCHPVGQSG